MKKKKCFPSVAAAAVVVVAYLETIPPYNSPYPSVEEREGSYAKLVNAYYELATLFYEWGWGSSFHFACRWRDESFSDSIKVRRPEWFVACITTPSLFVESHGFSQIILDPGRDGGAA